jgi:hypothetical protein
MSKSNKPNSGTIRKCIQAMTDRQLLGIGRACHCLSQNVFSHQFAECKRKWDLRVRVTAGLPRPTS